MKWRVSLLLVMASFAGVVSVYAEESPDTLRKAITEHSQQISELNNQISQYQKQLEDTQKKKQTLQTTINQLDISRKKISTSIAVTKKGIASTQAQISLLQNDISNKQSVIETDMSAIAETMRIVNMNDKSPVMLKFLSRDDVASIWNDYDNISSLQIALHDKINKVRKEKESLLQSREAQLQKKSELVVKHTELAEQNGSLNAVRKTQSQILAQTKSKESEYQKIIAEKKAQESLFESALSDLNSRLKITVNRNDAPASGNGVLKWPVSNVRITQYFGKTAFAASGAYNGKGHNGIDFGVPIGTPIKSSLSGTIKGVGNTDAVRGCYSFGKWVLVQHQNGLSTLYAHLSQVSVSIGQSVGTGELIGYSGQTGYATGPHLHYGVYISSAISIMKLGDATKLKTPCAGATMPVAPLEAYLNPMRYLPS